MDEFDLPTRIKIIDTGHFVDVDLDAMTLHGDTGTRVIRLREKSAQLAVKTARAYQFAVLHALNGRRKVSTVFGWTNEFDLFTRTIAAPKAAIATITLEMFNRYTAEKNASQVKLLRSALQYWAKLKLPGVARDLVDYLRTSQPPKPRSTAEIQNAEANERPFSTSEIRAISAEVDALFTSKDFDPQDNFLWKLMISQALRPAQMRLLEVRDIRFDSAEGAKTGQVYLNIPYVKQSGTPGRGYMEEHKLSESLTAAIKHHLDFLRASNHGELAPTQPLFAVINTKQGPRVETKPIQIFSKIEYTRIKVCSGSVDLENTDLFSRRFKHTKLTHLAILGAPIAVLARAGFQTSTGTLSRYINLSEEAFQDYETKLSETHQSIFDAFRGVIISADDATHRDADHAILGPELDADVGSCSATPCDVFAPIGCYACPRFEAFRDGPHQSVLRLLNQRAEAAERLDLPLDSKERDSHLIAAVEMVIDMIRRSAEDE